MYLKANNFLRHYFYPHESNNYKARTLHTSAIVFYITLLLVFQLIPGFIKFTQPNVLGYATNITLNSVLDLVNRERTKNNLAPLSLSPQLTTAATQKAADMFTKNYWAHVSPTGVSPWQFITSSGYSYLYAGENLAKSFSSSEEVVAAWMNSPTHKANILKSEYSDIGLAVMNGSLNGEETTLVVQELGTKVNKEPISKKTVSENVKDNLVKEVEPVIQTGSVSQAGDTTAKAVFPFRISKTMSLIITEFMLVILFLDSLYMWKYKTSRLSSRSLAHIIFFLSLIGAIGMTGIGVVL